MIDAIIIIWIVVSLINWAMKNESDIFTFICVWLLGGTPMALIGVGILSIVLFGVDRSPTDGGVLTMLIISLIIGLFVAAAMTTDASKDRKDEPPVEKTPAPPVEKPRQ